MNFSQDDKLVGTTVDRRYRISGFTGAGRLSQVYKAEDLERQYTVALKFLQPGLVAEKTFDKYRQAVQEAASLVHPNIVRLFSCESSADGRIYLVTDHVEATDLRKVVTEKGWLPWSLAVAIVAQVCDALEHAHQKGILHANLNPGNIMLISAPGDSYMAKIADFGVYHSSFLKQSIGSNTTSSSSSEDLYRSPEQVSGRKIDTRADLYTAGLVLYYCLTGANPPADKTMPNLSSPLLTKQLQAILARALAQNPNDRYQTASELSADLNLLLEVPPAEWDTKAVAMHPVVPLKSKSGSSASIDLRLPIAIAMVIVAIPVGVIVGLSYFDVQIEPLMPCEVAIQERLYEPTDPRLIKNWNHMIDYYKSQRKYAEAGACVSKVLKATEKPLADTDALEQLKLPTTD